MKSRNSSYTYTGRVHALEIRRSRRQGFPSRSTRPSALYFCCKLDCGVLPVAVGLRTTSFQASWLYLLPLPLPWSFVKSVDFAMVT